MRLFSSFASTPVRRGFASFVVAFFNRKATPQDFHQLIFLVATGYANFATLKCHFSLSISRLAVDRG
jgi:hypothetical protein